MKAFVMKRIGQVGFMDRVVVGVITPDWGPPYGPDDCLEERHGCHQGRDLP